MNKMEAERLPHILEFLDTLNFTVRRTFLKSRSVPRSAINWFDVNTAALLSRMLSLSLKNGAPQFDISIYELAESSHATYQSTRTRLERMEQFGLVEIESEWSKNHNRRCPSKITLHKHLAMALGKTARVSVRAEAAKYFATVGMKRLTGLGDLTDDERSGFDDLAKRVGAEKSRKQRDTAQWREHDDHFVAGAAHVWQFLQSYRGFGQQMPNWFGDNLAPSAARERRELTKLFQQYGGRVTAMAWWVFVGGQPAIDEKTGRPKFDIANPHVQFATVDKKPSQFAKHFNAFLSDKTFVEMATTSWQKSEPILQKWFGNVMDVGPRSGADDSDLVGFYIGQTSPTIGEVTHEISP
jgi:hypothetical protein